MITYWLYQGERLLTAIRMPNGTPDDAVRSKVIEQEYNMPLGHNAPFEAPFEFQNRLAYATVRTFPTVIGLDIL